MTSQSPDLEQASRFLACFAPPDSEFTFQGFAESQDAKGGKIRPTVIRGTLAQCAGDLARLNAHGAAIHFMVNASEGRGRTAKDVTAVRALFADTDGADLEPIRAAARPHAIVETSPVSWHVYWLVTDCPRERFSRLQKAIAARFGTDPSVSDLPRVMRVPGFWHWKAEPFMSRVVEIAE